MKTKIAIFGSTGSIGTQALQIARDNPNSFEVVTLVAKSSVDKLKSQILEFKPAHVFIESEENAKEIKEFLFIHNLKSEIFYESFGLKQISLIHDFDIAISALVGIAGLLPTFNLIKSGKRIALANKEVLVTGGPFILEQAKAYNATLLTVDSEHSAIMQCLQGEQENPIEKILLTASGGPFFTKELTPSISEKDVLAHPTWNMGAKITVDSATMMNKGFEVIEAVRLFNVTPEQVQVVVHRQSIMHSAVQFKDGTIMASLGPTDMRIPIAYALDFPKRLSNQIERVDLFKLLNLTFERPDVNRFPCLQYAYTALKEGLDKQIILNAADEIAVGHFLKGEINFITIPKIIYQVMESVTYALGTVDIDSILALNDIACKKAEEIVSKFL